MHCLFYILRYPEDKKQVNLLFGFPFMRYYSIIPNVLTMLRIALTPVIFVCVLTGGWWVGLGLLAFMLAGLTDYYDGYFARHFGVHSDFGRFLDPLADKILILCTLSSFAYLAIMPWWMVIVIGFRDACITTMRIVCARSGSRLQTSLIGKWKTALQLVAIFIVLATWFSFWLASSMPVFSVVMQRLGGLFYGLMFVVTAVTVFSGFSYVLEHMSFRS